MARRQKCRTLQTDRVCWSLRSALNHLCTERKDKRNNDYSLALVVHEGKIKRGHLTHTQMFLALIMENMDPFIRPGNQDNTSFHCLQLMPQPPSGSTIAAVTGSDSRLRSRTTIHAATHWIFIGLSAVWLWLQCRLWTAGAKRKKNAAQWSVIAPSPLFW